MPIKWVDSHEEKQCSALAKSTRQRCLNPAAYGCRTCRMHGARKQNSIKRGKNHPNYLHGLETHEAKRKRQIKFAEFREFKSILASTQILAQPC